jgi:DNA-directed RNA polymerase subunit RPC12/RpoP
MINLKCPECGGKIQLGVAIHPNEEYGARYLVKPPLITHKNLELIPVYKCMDCGYSCNDDRDLIWSSK